VDAEFTTLPCGNGCGATFTIVAKVEPREIRARVLEEGWIVVLIGTRSALFCPTCAVRHQADQAKA